MVQAGGTLPAPAPYCHFSPSSSQRRVLLSHPLGWAHAVALNLTSEKGCPQWPSSTLSVPFFLCNRELSVNHQTNTFSFAMGFLAGALCNPQQPAHGWDPLSSLSSFFWSCLCFGAVVSDAWTGRVMQGKMRVTGRRVQTGRNPCGCVTRQMAAAILLQLQQPRLFVIPLATLKPLSPPQHLRTHLSRLLLALSRQQQTAKETDSARITAPLSSEAATATREPVPEGCGAAAGQSGAVVSGARGEREGRGGGRDCNTPRPGPAPRCGQPQVMLQGVVFISNHCKK